MGFDDELKRARQGATDQQAWHDSGFYEFGGVVHPPTIDTRKAAQALAKQFKREKLWYWVGVAPNGTIRFIAVSSDRAETRRHKKQGHRRLLGQAFGGGQNSYTHYLFEDGSFAKGNYYAVDPAKLEHEVVQAAAGRIAYRS